MGKNKKLIIFTDSGDTIIDESTQRYAEDKPEIVQRADFIEDAGRVLETLHQAGYAIALVADGLEESFQNVYRENGLLHCFDGWVVSETVGVEKPEPAMFRTAMDAMGLTQEDIASRVHDEIERQFPETKHCQVHVNPQSANADEHTSR